MDRVEVKLRHTKKVDPAGLPGATKTQGKTDFIELELLLGGALTSEQERRLREIADHCPVHRALTGEIVIAHA